MVYQTAWKGWRTIKHAYSKDLAQIENVDKLRKTIRDSEVAEAEYYRYWVFYCWIIVIAFTVILILMSISIVLQKKKKKSATETSAITSWCTEDADRPAFYIQ